MKEIAMTDKTAKILQMMNRKKALKRLANPEKRDRILDEFNRDNMDDVGPIGGHEQGMKVLSEMNSLVDNHDAFLQSLAPTTKLL
jgi:hypothetical protein